MTLLRNTKSIFVLPNVRLHVGVSIAFIALLLKVFCSRLFSPEGVKVEPMQAGFCFAFTLKALSRVVPLIDCVLLEVGGTVRPQFWGNIGLVEFK
jgi:hypothetical protein